MEPEVLERQALVFPKLIEADMEPDSLTLTASYYRTAQEWFESPELQSCILRFAVTGAVDITEAGLGTNLIGMATSLSTIGFNRGGTHMIAHAAHQILNQLGCEFHVNKEVDRVIIENGNASGIRLDDGTEIEARKLVVSTLSPNQLIFDLIGKEHVEEKLAKRVALLENTFGCIMWYSLAVHEAPIYKAEAFNPDIHETEWLGLQPDPDPIHIARECRHAKLLSWPPPIEDYCPTVWCNSLVDPSFAPAGKHVLQNEQLGPPVSLYSEKAWMEIRERYAEDLINLWKDYAPNMTWDNIIGIDTNSPYDHTRMKNLLPNGTMAGIDRPPHQINENRPTPELANHRTPIKNLYATGGCWHVGTNAGSSESYNCYKIIAKDLDLGKPWEEPGTEEPDSLLEQYRAVRKRVQDTVKKD